MAYLDKAFPEVAEWKAVVDHLISFQQRLDRVGDERGVCLDTAPAASKSPACHSGCRMARR